ncbi:hypothetical protein [Haloarcula sp. CBA1122]|uniref:hypothetical protein n=1 Tax=Haloarcula sp. CBA1122 TaxID=2668069 RepID=UPI00130914DE|nr:hypothetical protein [Haloarcula sp. CBA1122]MUV50982.1 hypothetical protein [Haloarcula sp. CBA1122]
MTSIVPGRGWYLEVDHPGGNIWRPDVVGEPTPQPTINGLPRLSVPVRASDRYARGDFDGQPMRAWFNGVRLPVDQVDTPRATERGWILEGRGAVELDERVRMEVDSRPAHLVADDIIGQTPYTADVDAPPSAATETLVQSASTQSEWEQLLPDLPSTSPLQLNNGTLEVAQTSWLREAEEETFFGGVRSDSNASAGEMVAMSSTVHELEYSWTPQYDIPAGELGASIRLRAPSGSGPGFEVTIDGNSVYLIPAGGYGSDRFTFLQTYGANDAPSVSAGSSVSVKIAVTEENGNVIEVDTLGLTDARFSYTFPDNVNSDGYLPGPESHPQLLLQDTDDAVTSLSAEGARVNAAYDNVSTNQQLQVSNDQGGSYVPSNGSENNTETVDVTFDQASSTVRARFGLSRYGSGRQQSPANGYNAQSVSSYELYADLNEQPLVINQTFDDDISTVLNRIAPPGTVWQAVRDGDSYRVIWTEAGQRTTDAEDDVSSWEYERRVEQAVDKVVIKGSVLRRRDERVTAQHDTAVPLDETELVHGRETVYDPGTSTEYVEGQDYSLNAQPGELVALSSGNISDGQEVAIDYGYRPVGESSTTVSDPHTIVRSITGLTTDRECTLVAKQLASELDTPVTEGTVTLSADRTDWSLVESRAFAALPTAEQVDIHDAQPSASGTDLRIGSRQPLEEIIEDIRNRVSQNAERS